MDESLSSLFHSEALQILDALRERARYRYVQPVVLPHESGWKIVSPCCSRNVDTTGGQIDIAWMEPAASGWRLYARDHQVGQWVVHVESGTMKELLDVICLDASRVFWP